MSRRTTARRAASVAVLLAVALAVGLVPVLVLGAVRVYWWSTQGAVAQSEQPVYLQRLMASWPARIGSYLVTLDLGGAVRFLTSSRSGVSNESQPNR